MLLRQYQVELVDKIREAYRSGARAPLLQSSTGSGKTVIFSHICAGAARKGNIVWILVHRQELLDQVSSALNSEGVTHGIIASGYAPEYALGVQAASVFSLARRLDKVPEPDLIIIDEAHHAIRTSTWGKVVERFPKAKLLGTTATPQRLSGEGLGDIFDRLVVGPRVNDLISQGYLSAPKVYAPPTIDVSQARTRMGDFAKADLSHAVDKPKVTGEAIDHYNRLCPGKRAVVFCVSLDHAAHMVQAARSAGLSAVQVDGSMDRGIRRSIINDFKDGKIAWLVTVDLVSEGFDCPGIEVGICLRPTQSLGLWLQQCGRVLRPAAGKSHALILDHAGNSLRHGLPTEERDWSLDGTAKGNRRANAVGSVRVCPECFSAQRSGKPTCTDCGHTFKIEPRKVEKEEGTLKEITAEEIARRRARQDQGRAGRAQLVELGRMRGYKSPEKWADYVITGRMAKRQA